MTRRVQGSKTYLAQVKHLTIIGHYNRIIGFCAGAIHNWRAGGLAQVNVATHKIGMKMGFENVSYGSAATFCQR